MTTLYDLLDQPEPANAVNAALLRIAEHFEEMSRREHANGNHVRAEALRDCAIYVKLQKES